MTLPVNTVTMPSDLQFTSNGRLTVCQLVPVVFPGAGNMSLHPAAARSWNAMAVACYAATKLSLSGTGAYRSYDAQLAVFNDRYTPSYNPLVNTTLHKRTWLGKTWYLRRGMAAVTSPGRSNHGWGIAVDAGWWTGVNLPGYSDIAGVTTKPEGWQWLLDNAHRFSWSWEMQSEPWHIRYCAGDWLPQAVADIEAYLAAVSAAA